MKATDFLKILTMVQPGLSSKETLEQSTSFVFIGGQVITYNGHICVRADLPKAFKKLEGAVDADSLFKLLTRAGNNSVQIKMTKTELQVIGANFSSGIKRQSEIRLPEEDARPNTKGEKVSEELLEAIATCLFSCGSDKSTPLLTFVHCSPDHVETCDNYRVTRYTLETGLKKSILIPFTSARALVDYEIQRVANEGSWLHFFGKDGLCFSCRTTGESYPSLDHLFQKGENKIALPDDLPEQLKTAGIFIDADHKKDEAVELTISVDKSKKGTMTLKTKSLTGWYEGTIDVKAAKPVEMTVKVNPSLLSDMARLNGYMRAAKKALIFKSSKFIHIVAVFG